MRQDATVDMVLRDPAQGHPRRWVVGIAGNWINSRAKSRQANCAILTIDGSRHFGSGAIVRQAVAFSTLTGRPIDVVNACASTSAGGS